MVSILQHLFNEYELLPWDHGEISIGQWRLSLFYENCSCRQTIRTLMAMFILLFIFPTRIVLEQTMKGKKDIRWHSNNKTNVVCLVNICSIMGDTFRKYTSSLNCLLFAANKCGKKENNILQHIFPTAHRTVFHGSQNK